jgi:nucleoside-diphosphate-sugar epimerase
MKDVILTGSESGLGKFLSKNLDRPFHLGYGRDFEELSGLDVSNSVLIHCGFSRIAPDHSVSIRDYQRNLVLTANLLKYNFKQVIYLSTIDVYPKQIKAMTEDYNIKNEDVTGVYTYQKLIAEKMTKDACGNHIILRMPMLVGLDTKPNSIRRLINGTNVGLCGESTINVITHQHVLDFITAGLIGQFTGVFNLTAKTNVKLLSLKSALNSKTMFGDFLYETPILDNSKAQKILPDLKSSSMTIVENFVAQNL